MKPKRKNDRQAVGRVAWWQVIWLVGLVIMAVGFRQILVLDYPSDAYARSYLWPGGRLFVYAIGLFSLTSLYVVVSMWRWYADVRRGRSFERNTRLAWMALHVPVICGLLIWNVSLFFGSLSTPNQPFPDIQYLDGVRYGGDTYHAYFVNEVVPGWGAVLDAEVFRCNWLGRGCQRHLTTITEIGPDGYFLGTYPRGIDRTNGQANSAWLTCDSENPTCPAGESGSGAFVLDEAGTLHLCLRPPGMVCITENIPDQTSPHGRPRP